MLHRSLTLGLAAAVLGTALVSAPAAGADLDFGFDNSLPPPPALETKVEFGTGWYIRGDIAGTLTHYENGLYQPPNSQSSYIGVVKTHEIGYDLSLGAGYKFTNSFRVDVDADFLQPSKVTNYTSYCVGSYDMTCTSQGKLFNYDALFNVYYDIGTWGPVTPYVGAGAGLSFANFSNRIYGGSDGTYGSGLGAHSFAFALMAGVAFDVYNHVKLDVGYRYLNDGTMFGEKFTFQEFRVGARYMIDN